MFFKRILIDVREQQMIYFHMEVAKDANNPDSRSPTAQSHFADGS